MIDRDDFLYALDLIAAEVAAAGGWGVILLSTLLSWIVPAIFYALVFHKAGIGWWKAFVPILNYVKYFQLAGMNAAWIYIGAALFVGAVFLPIILAWISLQTGDQSFLTFVQVYLFILTAYMIAVSIASLVATYRIGVGFGHGFWFFLLGIFFPYIWCIVIAAQSEYWDEDYYPSSIGVNKGAVEYY